ncbi:hypothetical protein TBR22_A24850 [Luteitalea sp. TBR-22]|uniref:CcmD family protein n=1 Tax=Luteitalea sp. TBR-22 TaxID=2802971 RepID=UPI001AF1CB0D|nr:CcmD family protein [Luteitalea sp. TBR-22]BCS33258.1 hypothetical protein TBR22_A24850 [Luteitalea sp. TBR-22]
MTTLVTRYARSLALACALLAAVGVRPALAQAPETQPGKTTTAAQDEYVPIDQLPDNEKLPAAPFVIGAYAVAWVAILVYLLMLWRRLGRVEADLHDARRLAAGK